jgi:hypothetical protein
MASVVLNQETNSQIYAGGVLAGARGLTTSGAVRAGGSSATGSTFTGSISIVDVSPPVAGATNPTEFTLYAADRTGGGLVAGHAQLFGYFDPLEATPTVAQFMDIYPASIAGGVASQTVVRTNQCVPFNFAAPFTGTTTGTGAPLVVACAGIPAGSEIRFMLVGTNAAVYAPIVPPAAVSVQPNVSFTYTGTVGAIYDYEVLFA